jgi:hypothetical protein
MRAWVFALIVAWMAWLALAVVLGERVASDAVDANSAFACALPGHDSQWGEASWKWWPPGEVCRNSDGKVFQAPASWRSNVVIVLSVGIVALPLATVVLARRDREEADESSVDLSELVG